MPMTLEAFSTVYATGLLRFLEHQRAHEQQQAPEGLEAAEVDSSAVTGLSNTVAASAIEVPVTTDDGLNPELRSTAVPPAASPPTVHEPPTDSSRLAVRHSSKDTTPERQHTSETPPKAEQHPVAAPDNLSIPSERAHFMTLPFPSSEPDDTSYTTDEHISCGSRDGSPDVLDGDELQTTLEAESEDSETETGSEDDAEGADKNKRKQGELEEDEVEWLKNRKFKWAEKPADWREAVARVQEALCGLKELEEEEAEGMGGAGEGEEGEVEASSETAV